LLALLLLAILAAAIQGGAMEDFLFAKRLALHELWLKTNKDAHLTGREKPL
jgi:hypothetical protein